MTESFRIKNSVFFAWTRVSRRSEQLARHFNSAFIRYNRWGNSTLTLLFSLIVNFIRTFLWIVFKRPAIIFTFNAHPFVTISAKLGTWVTMKGQVIPDLHTAAYTDHFSGMQAILGRWIWKKSPVVLVHNLESKIFLSEKIPDIEDKLFVLEDALPGFDQEQIKSKSKSPNCVLISRFAPDEPIQEFFDAVSGIMNCHFFITGNQKKAKFDLSPYADKNITFSGFVSDQDYLCLLRSADFITILTKRDMTLLSGGYEALALEKPVILSETQTLMDYFEDSAIYTPNTVDGIQEAVKMMLDELEKRGKRVQCLKEKKIIEWNKKARELHSIVESLA